MAASKTTMKESIQPGSTEYGQRGALEGAIDQLPAGGGAAGGAPPIAAGAAGIGPGDPLGAMLSGEVPPNELPVTDGLPHGPGQGTPTPQIDPLHAKLLDLATNAKTPALRTQARAALRKMVREKNAVR